MHRRIYCFWLVFAFGGVAFFAGDYARAASPAFFMADPTAENAPPIVTENVAELPEAPSSVEMARVSGTVEDSNGDLVPGATVTLRGSLSGSVKTTQSDGNAMFLFDNVDPAQTYTIEIHAKEFVDWRGPQFRTESGQLYLQTEIHMRVKANSESVTVYADPNYIATEQMHVEIQQRAFGIVPNFYVSYDPNPAPLSPKLKFKLAVRVAFDPVTIAGSAFIAGIYQVAWYQNYPLGSRGYGERFGYQFANETTDVFFGGAIFPVLFHQDPRYMYQGTGSTYSRMKHAMANPFICRGDNGKNEINFSSIGGDLASGFISKVYAPSSESGNGDVMESFAIGTALRVATSLTQEFILGHFTSRGKNKK